ncbi:hypothetical protein [Bordetella genomosp. 13]|uniref:Response regulatory domain-containing protein n=1 Tax=Bordetella genomosp. 13 TaxID=463040 RepID=A0A1W6Z8D0_9BORD|nr:hypothetical protein [Bordetella genomosp. 13]ARP93380.1 hypothetical protein CAL15_02670 [Bordetella genomosp. 13]
MSEFPSALVVAEPHPLIRTLLSDALKRQGIQALPVADTDEAIVALETRGDVCAIICDATVAGTLDGYMLAWASNQRWPLVSFALTAEHFSADLEKVPDDVFVMRKPYALSTMLTWADQARRAAALRRDTHP